jgi:hypothetical protein
MIRNSRMCSTCPFRGADETYRRESAEVHPELWPCHTDDLYGENGIQCRGHWEAQRKFGKAA